MEIRYRVTLLVPSGDLRDDESWGLTILFYFLISSSFYSFFFGGLFVFSDKAAVCTLKLVIPYTYLL